MLQPGRMENPSSSLVVSRGPGRAVARTGTPRLVAVVLLAVTLLGPVLTVLVTGSVPGPTQLLAAVVGVAVFARLWPCRVELTVDAARIVNPIRTHRVPRSQIAEISLGRPLVGPRFLGQQPGRLDIVRRDGTRIWAVGCSVLPRHNLPRSTPQRDLAQVLEHWVQTGRLPQS